MRIISIFFIFFLFSTPFLHAQSLSGTYSIGGTNPDYTTLTSAKNDLQAFGVSGPVVFDVAPGTYNEQLILNQITGTSTTNTITFQGDSATNTIIAHTSSYVASLSVSTDYVTIKNFTIQSYGAPPSGNSSNRTSIFISGKRCTLENNRIFMDSTYAPTNTRCIYISGSGSLSGDGGDSITIRNNYFFGSNTAIIAKGYSTNLIDDLVIDNNIIYKPYGSGISTEYLNNPIITNNYISGRYLQINGALLTPSIGLQVVYSNSPIITHNQVRSRAKAFILNQINYNTTTSPNYLGEFSNNIGVTNATFSTGCEMAGIRYFKFYNNTLRGNGKALVFHPPATGSQNVDFRNNIFYSESSYALHIDVFQGMNIFDTLDYNIYHSPIGHPLVNVYYDDYHTLADFKTSFPNLNNHSLYGEPLFTSDLDLHLIGNLAHNTGDNNVNITTDYDGDTRPLTPNTNIDIGADEFTPGSYLDIGVVDAVANTAAIAPNTPFDIELDINNYGTIDINNFDIQWSINGTSQTNIPLSNAILIGDTLFDYTINNISLGNGKHILRFWTNQPNSTTDAIHLNDTFTLEICVALTGVYTVGTNNADFNSLSEVVEILNCGGIIGATTINIQSGLYEETIELNDIQGTSLSTPLVFDGIDTSLVTIRRTAPSTNNATITLNGTKYTSFKNMTIEYNDYNADASVSHYAIELKNMTQHDSLLNNRIQVYPYNAGIDLFGIGTSTTDNSDIIIQNNHILNGSTGIVLTDSVGTNGHLITNNTIEDFGKTAITLTKSHHSKIKNNQIQSLENDVINAIESHHSKAIEIENNNIYVAKGGLQIENTDNSNTTNILIINNMIVNDDNYSMSFDSVIGAYIFNNSVYGEKGMYISNISDISINNNILVSKHSPTFESENATTTYLNLNLDYNIYYSDSSILALDGSTSYSDLTTWQNSTPFNTQSIEEKPCFVSETDLHIHSSNGHNAGLTNAMTQGIVAEDIDNENRQGNIDIGADEYVLLNNDLGILEVVGLESGCDLADSFSVVFQNFGFINQSNYTLNYWINDTLQGMSSYPSTSALDVCALDTITFYTNDFLNNMDTFDIDIIISLNNDENLSNDTLNLQVFNDGIENPIVSQVGCFGNTNVLQATSTGVNVWYDDENLSNQLHIGDVYTTLPLLVADTFYVKALDLTYESVGSPASASTGSLLTNTFGNGLLFTVYDDVIIDSVSVYPDGTGTLQIHVLDQANNSVVHSSPVHNVSGNLTTKVPLYVGANLLPGNYLISITYTGLSGLVRDASFNNYPLISTDGKLEITSATTANNTIISYYYYYWFYDWKLRVEGCPSDVVEVVVNPSLLSINSTVTDVACTGNTLGAIDLNINSAIYPVSYNWNTGATDSTLSNLSEGTYSVTVTDQTNCSVTETIQISVDTDSLSINTIATDIACFGSTTGSIQINTINGNYPIMYNWSNGSTDSTLSNLSGGTYYLTVTDQNACSIFDTIQINISSDSIFINSIITDIACFGDSTGSIQLNVFNGNYPILYSWNNGSTDSTLLNLPIGTYDVTITDSLNCSVSDTITLVEPSPLFINILTTPDTSLLGVGSATLTVLGGTIPYTINWSNGQIFPNLSNLTAGDYFVTLTDGNGCEKDTMITITNVVSTFNNSNLSSYSIYPNPTNQIVNLDLTTSKVGNLSLNIYNTLGQVMKQLEFGNVNTINTSIDISTLNQGTYIMEVQMDKQQILREVIMILE